MGNNDGVTENTERQEEEEQQQQCLYSQEELDYVLERNKRLIVGFLVGEKFPFYTNKWVISQVTQLARAMQPCALYFIEPIGIVFAKKNEYPVFQVYQDRRLVLTYKYIQIEPDKEGIYTCRED